MEQRESDNHDTGTWVVALAPGAGFGYLGRVEKLDGRAAYTRLDLDASNVEMRDIKMKPRSEVPVEEVLEANIVTLNPAYAYREMVKEVPVFDPATGKMVPDPQVPGIPMTMPMRTPLVMPVGFTAEVAPVHLRGKSYDFRFLSQMDRRDAETYRRFARDTRNQMTDMRMQASGLAAPTKEETERANRSKT